MQALSDLVATARSAVVTRPLLAIALTNLGTAFVGFALYAKTQGGIVKVVKRYVFVAAVGTLKTVASGVVNAEQEKVRKKTRDAFLGKIRGERYRVLPAKGMAKDKLIKYMHEESALERQWRDAKVSGMVYHSGPDVHEVIVESFKAFLTSNPLHPGVFPTVRKMEAEVVQMCVDLFRGGDNVCGTMTSGGTESNLMAIKTYRDWARATKGVTDPELIKPQSAHASFDKACELLCIRCIEVPVSPETFQVDVKAVTRAVTRNTIAIVGSAVCFSQGVADDIQALAAIAKQHGVGLHVDNCLGSLLLPFLPAAGYPVKPFDFSVDGVTSLSADTHKYGYAPKGSSVILYANRELRAYQYCVYPDWMGSIYATPAIAGSRPGALIAGTWGVMMHMGKDGYAQCAKQIMTAVSEMRRGIEAIPDLCLQGEPVMSVLCFTTRRSDVSIYNVSDAMSQRGWELSLMQFPAGLHICVTHIHTPPGVAQTFIKDLRDSVEHVKTAKPGEFKDGVGAIYGVAEQIPDRSMVSDIAIGYLDTLYTA